MPNVQRLLASARHDLREQLRLVPALLPLARDVPHRPVRPQQHGHGECGAAGRLPEAAPDAREHAAGVAAGGRLPHRPPRQVPERLRTRQPDRGAAGLERVVRLHRPVDVPLLRLHAERERPPGHVRRRAPQDYQTDVYASKAVEIIRRLAPRGPAVLPQRRVPGAALGRAARRRRPAQPGDAGACATPPRPLRERAAADAAVLQRGQCL